MADPHPHLDRREGFARKEDPLGKYLGAKTLLTFVDGFDGGPVCFAGGLIACRALTVGGGNALPVESFGEPTRTWPGLVSS